MSKPLVENQILYISGYRMRATEVKLKGQNKLGEDVYSFKGAILDDEYLKKTSYNGGYYTWRASDRNLVPQDIDTNGIRSKK